jgi:hypothetical protein
MKIGLREQVRVISKPPSENNQSLAAASILLRNF